MANHLMMLGSANTKVSFLNKSFTHCHRRTCRMQESEVVFIDMRGALGDLVSTEGDMNYDLSKVYQSLCGYDFIILDRDVDEKAAEMLLDLKEVRRNNVAPDEFTVESNVCGKRTTEVQ